MKKWETPQIYDLGIKDTLTDTTYSHECHSIKNNCKDFTNGEHAAHTIPTWTSGPGHEGQNGDGHTCCCSEITENPGMS